MSEETKGKTEQERTLLKFLKQTREGKYAEIEESSLAYSRIYVKREIVPEKENYYYSLA